MPQEHLTLLGHTAGDAGEACTAPGLLGCPHATLRDTRPCLLLLACLHGPLGSAPRQSMCGTVCVGGGGGTGQVGCPSPAHLEVLVVAMTSPRL